MKKTGFTPENIVYTPKNIISFISELVSPWHSKKILDPACGSASFFWNINKKAKVPQDFTGVDIGPEIIEIAKNNLETTNIFWKLVNEDYFKIHKKLGKFDLIVSQPSFNQLKEIISVRDFDFLNNEFAYLFTSLDLLEKDGYLVFILPEQKSFFFSDYHFPMRNYLLDNYSVEAIISLPNDLFYPEATIKTCLLIIKNSTQRENVFFAKCSSENADMVLENFYGEKSGENLLNGFWEDSSELAKSNVSWTFDYFKSIRRLKSKKEESKYKIKNLSEIVEFKDEFSEFEEILLIPKSPVEDMIFRSEFEEDDITNYLPCKCIDENVSPQYLKLYLNSADMKNERNLFSHGTFQRYIDIVGLNSLLIEIPELKVQNQIVETNNLSDKNYQKMKTLYNSFKAEIFSYDNLLQIMSEFEEIQNDDLFYKNLIWPFATSYHIAVKTTCDKNTS
jgi:type I restriction-modification system DNA methylase subunit